MSIEIRITGLAELQAVLDTMPAKIEKNILRGALRAGMKTILPSARANVRSVSGELARGLRIKTGARDGRVTATMSARGKHGFIARFVEFGTAAHLISARGIALGRRGRQISIRTINRSEKKGSLSFSGTLTGRVDHPGARARPFLRPALDAGATGAVIAAGEYMKQRLAEKHGLDTSDIEIGEER